MGFLREVKKRAILFFFGGEAFLVLTCASCGHVVQRRIVEHELEEWVLHLRHENRRCPECGLESVTARLIREREFRKRYPHYMQGG